MSENQEKKHAQEFSLTSSTAEEGVSDISILEKLSSIQEDIRVLKEDTSKKLIGKYQQSAGPIN